MPTSINGWSVVGSPPWSDPRLTRLKIPGTPCVAYMRASVAPLFVSLALDYHHAIHPLVNRNDVDSYDYRVARAGGGAWSDHSSGTATDFRASYEGAQGPQNYDWWNGSKSAAAREILARYEILMWGGAKALGGSYTRPEYFDWMHWALKPGTTQADVNRVIARLGIRADGTRPEGPLPTPGAVKPKPPKVVNPFAPKVSVANVQPGKSGSQVLIVQKCLAKAVGLNYSSGPGVFGPRTKAAYAQWQRKLGYAGSDANGVPGKASLSALGARYGFRVVP